MIVVNQRQVIELLGVRDCMDAMRAVLSDLARGACEQPLRQIMWYRSAYCAGVFVSAACAFVAAVLIMSPLPAAAQDGDLGAFADTLGRLERQLQTLERTVYRGDPPPPAAAASAAQAALPSAAATQLQVRIDQFEREMRRLTGQVERLGFDMRQLTGRLDKLVADVDFRLRQLEGGEALVVGQAEQQTIPLPGQQLATGPAGDTPLIGQELPLIEPGSTVRVIGTLPQAQLDQVIAAPPETATAPGPTAPVRQVAAASAASNVSLPPGAADEQYNYARGFLMQRDFAGAEQAFTQFITANPDTELTGNAQYWLGETFYVRQNYLDAAQAFAKGYQDFPDSSKAPDNLLKLGLSLANLGRQDDACITLSKLTGEYPKAPTIIIQRAARESERLGCG